MKSDLKDLSGCKKELQMEISSEEASREFEKTLKRYAQKAKIKGFRPGKAPKDMVKRLFHSEIKSSVIDSLVPKALQQELKKQNINPVDTPVIKELNFEEGQPLQVKAQLEIWPDFELPDYKNIKVKKKTSSVSQKEVENSLRELQARSAQYIPVEKRGIQNGDYVVAEFKGRDKNTNKFLPTEKANFIVGHENNPSELNENILGMKPQEEKTFDVSHSQDHSNQRLAGKDVEYTVKILSVKEQKLPEINDDFAKDLGNYDNLENLKKHIKEELEKSKENAQRNETANEIIQKISDLLNLNLPETVVEKEQQAVLKRFLSSYGQANPNQEEMEKLKSEARKKAEQNIKNHLILNKIAQKEQIEISEEEINDELKSIAKQNNVPLSKVIQSVNKEGKREEIKDNIRLRKTVDFLMKHAIIE